MAPPRVDDTTMAGNTGQNLGRLYVRTLCPVMTQLRTITFHQVCEPPLQLPFNGVHHDATCLSRHHRVKEGAHQEPWQHA